MSRPSSRAARPRHQLRQLPGLFLDGGPIAVTERCGICDRNHSSLPGWATYEPSVECIAARAIELLDQGVTVTVIDRQTGASTTWLPDGTTIDRTPDAEEARVAAQAPSGTTPTHFGEGRDRHHRTH